MAVAVAVGTEVEEDAENIDLAQYIADHSLGD